MRNYALEKTRVGLWTISGHGIRDVGGKFASCPMHTPEAAVASKGSPAATPAPSHCQGPASSQSELSQCRSLNMEGYKAPKSRSCHLSDGFPLHLEQNPEFLSRPSRPCKSFFLSFEHTHLATIPGPSHCLFAQPRPLSQLPEFPRAGASHRSGLPSPFYVRHRLPTPSIPHNSTSVSSEH